MKTTNALLTQDQLGRLAREFRATPVLSVYIDGAAPDPARRLAWRQELRNALDDARASAVSNPRASAESFDHCRQLLLSALDVIPSAIGSPGWIGFITDEGIRLHGPIPAPMPTLVKWQLGAWVAPVRPRDQAAASGLRGRGRHAFGGAVPVPGRRARGRWIGGIRSVSAGTQTIWATRRASISTAGHAARRRRTPRSTRASRRATTCCVMSAHRLSDLMKDDAVSVIGGAPDTAHAFHRAIPAALASRVLVSDALPSGSSEAEIARAVGARREHPA